MTDLFLSYARKDDEPFVAKLHETLSAQGYNVWFDREKMPNRGLTFTENIRRAVLGSKRLALIVGPHALTSDYVTYEWRTANDACIPVIPLLRQSDYADLPEELAGFDAPDFRDDATFEAMLAYLTRQLAGEVHAPGKVHGLRFRLPRGYVLRRALWNDLEQAVRGDAVGADVATSREQITALQGMAGLGKTVMAAAYAESCAVRRTFDHGVFWLTAGRAADAFEMHVQLAKLMGVDTDDFTPDNSTEKVRLLLDGRRVLLVLDDVWAHELVTDGFEPLLGDHTRLLFTTRNARIVTRTQAQRVRVETLDTDQGVRLIGRWLDRKPDDDNPHLDSERAIVALLRGHTLAVTLAAARIDEVGPGYAPTLLAEYQAAQASANPFDDLEIADDDKNWSVELSLRLSYDALSEPGRAHFRALGVLAENETFKGELAAALWEVESPRKGLTELTSAAMLDPEPDGRYGQHPVLRAYAAALLRREDAYQAAFLRYADYMIVFIYEYVTKPPEEWAHLDAEKAHIAEVGDALVAGYARDDDTRARARDFTHNTTRYLFHRREVRRQAWLEAGLALARADGEQKRERLFLGELGNFYNDIGEKQRAIELYTAALELAREIEDQSGEAFALGALGHVWSALGEKHKALDFFNQALPIYRAVGDRSGEATTLNNIGSVWDDLGEMQQALDFYNQALPIDRAVGDRSGEATTLNNIGSVWDDLGDKQQALTFYNQALPIRRDVGDRSGEATTLNNIGRVWSALGDKQQALTFYNQALPIRRDVGDRSGEATTLHNIGGVWSALGDKQQALDYYNQALPIQRAIGDRSGEATTLNNIGGVWDDLGEAQQALDFYNQALPIRRAVGDRSGEATTLNNIGHVWDALGDKQQALDFYNQALPIFRAVGDRNGEATTLNNIGYIHFQNGDLEKTVEIQQQIIAVVREMGAVASEALFLFNIAAVYERLGQVNEAIASAEAGRALLVKHNLPQNAGGTTLAQYDAFLARLRGETPPSNPVMDAIRAFLDTSNWSEAREVYAAHEAQLASDEAERIFEQNIANADDERFKANLQAHLDRIRRAKTEGIDAAFAENAPSEEEQAAEGLRQLAALYAQGGESAVRELLAGQVEDAVIDQIIAQLATASDQPNTLPPETVQTLAGNTAAVRTSAPEHLASWREQLQQIRGDFAGRGDDFAIEVAFADALLAVLDGASPTLPDDNPYADVLRQVVAAVEEYDGAS